MVENWSLKKKSLKKLANPFDYSTFVCKWQNIVENTKEEVDKDNIN